MATARDLSSPKLSQLKTLSHVSTIRNLTDIRRQDTSSLSLHVRRLDATCDELRVDLKTSIETAQNTLLAKIEEQASSLRTIGRQQSLQKGSVDFEDRRAYYCSLQAVPVQINQFLQSIGNVAKCNLILRSLLVADIARREEQIHEAYDKTFDWIFDGDDDEEIHEDHDNVDAARKRFEQWLRTSSEVFWINGKAGSGKSTLMKYLASHARRKRLMWASALTATRLSRTTYFGLSRHTIRG